jgi:uncharacterized protein YkwD
LTYHPIFGTIATSCKSCQWQDFFKFDFSHYFLLNPERSRRIMKVGFTLFLALAFFAISGTVNIHAQGSDLLDQTLGASSLERFDLSENTLPSKFDLAVSESGMMVKPCIPFLAHSPVCTANYASLCTPTPKPQEEDSQVQQPLVAPELLPEPTLAQIPTIEHVQETQITPSPTMTALQNEYAPRDAILNQDKIFDLVNQYRASRGLAPFEREDSVCELAQTRSSEIIAEVQNGTLHSGLYNRPLPYWIFENAKYGSNEEGTVAWWLASSVHHRSIISDYKYSCVRCTGSYCTQLFTSFSPKQTAISEQALSTQ